MYHHFRNAMSFIPVFNDTSRILKANFRYKLAELKGIFLKCDLHWPERK